MARKFEIEEEEGGYVRNGDVLEWVWKEPKAEPAPKDTKQTSKKAKA